MRRNFLLEKKRNGEGAADYSKEWLVTNIFRQVKRLDLMKLFLPILRYTKVWLKLPLLVSVKHKRRTFDPKNSFTNIFLRKTTYVI